MKGEGGDLCSRGALGVRAQCGEGCDLYLWWIAFLIKDSQQLFGIFTVSTHVLSPAFGRNSLQVHLAPGT